MTRARPGRQAQTEGETYSTIGIVGIGGAHPPRDARGEAGTVDDDEHVRASRHHGLGRETHAPQDASGARRGIALKPIIGRSSIG